MKKILLMLLLLLTIFSIIQAEEVDREKYMPQKLIYSELPEDYPKELDELFEFYYDTVKIMDTWGCTYRESREKLKSYIETIKIEKQYRLAYLIWLSHNSIPEYYSEYININNRPERAIVTKLFTWQDLYRFSIYPEQQINIAKSEDRIGKQNMMPDLLSINLSINKSIVEKNELIEPFLNISMYPIWAKVQIIATETIEIDHPIASPVMHAKCKILDSFGDKFRKDEVTIAIVMFGNNYLMKPGQEYLINMRYIIKPNPEKELSPLRYLDNDPQMRFTSQISRVYEVTNDIVTEIALKPSFGEAYNPLNHLSKLRGHRDYNEIKYHTESLIDTLKGEYHK